MRTIKYQASTPYSFRGTAFSRFSRIDLNSRQFSASKMFRGVVIWTSILENNRYTRSALLGIRMSTTIVTHKTTVHTVYA